MDRYLIALSNVINVKPSIEMKGKINALRHSPDSIISEPIEP